MEILLTKSKGAFKYIKIAESSLGLNYSGTIIYFCPSKDNSLWRKAYDPSPPLPERKKRFFHFFKKKDHVENLDEEVVPDKSDEIILSALGSVFSKIKMLACSQSEGKPNHNMEDMIEGCRIAIIYIHVVLKNGDSGVMNECYIPLKMFVKDAESFDYYDGSSFIYLFKANDNVTEMTKNLERISQTDFYVREKPTF